MTRKFTKTQPKSSVVVPEARQPDLPHMTMPIGQASSTYKSLITSLMSWATDDVIHAFQSLGANCQRLDSQGISFCWNTSCITVRRPKTEHEKTLLTEGNCRALVIDPDNANPQFPTYLEAGWNGTQLGGGEIPQTLLNSLHTIASDTPLTVVVSDTRYYLFTQAIEHLKQAA